MSSKTFKVAGSTIAVLTGFNTDSPSLDITGITQANPPVFTVVGHGLSDGDVVKPHDIVGMIELNDEVGIVNVLSSSTFELLGFDATGYTAWSSGGQIDVGEFSNFCELTGYSRQGASSGEIDSTSLCSTSKEYEVGLSDAGTTQIDFKFAPQTAIQTALKTFDKSKDKMAVRIDLPKSGGRRVQLGIVQQTSESGNVGAIWTGSATIRNTGGYEDFEAA